MYLTSKVFTQRIERITWRQESESVFWFAKITCAPDSFEVYGPPSRCYFSAQQLSGHRRVQFSRYHQSSGRLASVSQVGPASCPGATKTWKRRAPPVILELLTRLSFEAKNRFLRWSHLTFGLDVVTQHGATTGIAQLFISARITSALQAFFARGVRDTQATSFVDL